MHTLNMKQEHSGILGMRFVLFVQGLVPSVRRTEVVASVSRLMGGCTHLAPHSSTLPLLLCPPFQYRVSLPHHQLRGGDSIWHAGPALGQLGPMPTGPLCAII